MDTNLQRQEGTELPLLALRVGVKG